MNCAVHPDRAAEAVCCECRAGVCGTCRNKMFGRNYCDTCAAQLEQKVMAGGAGQRPQTSVVVHESAPAVFQVPVPRKDPTAAALLSVFFPGAGQLYSGRVGRGIGIFFATWTLMTVGIGVILWGAQIYDAYTCARDHNRAAGLDHGALPPPA